MEKLRKVALEFNEVMGLLPPIDIIADRLELEKGIREAIKFIDTNGELTEETTNVLKSYFEIEVTWQVI